MMAGDKTWARTPGTYISGRAYIDGADETAAEMEAKWGCDRLRLLVGPELREKFDRQRFLLQAAIEHGELHEVIEQAGRMCRAWKALDAAAEAAGAKPLSPEVWEVTLPSTGEVVAIVRDNAAAHGVVVEGRAVVVYTLEEIGRFLSNYPAVAKAKAIWPGATITAIRRSVDDPLKAIHDTDEPLDDPIPW